LRKLKNRKPPQRNLQQNARQLKLKEELKLGKKGKTARLKRKPAPRFWPIHRKDLPWVIKPSSGPHSLEKCLPLSLVLRDILGVAETRRESQTIIHQGKILVDGKVQSRDDIPVGLMDVIAMPESNQYYRLVPYKKGLFLSEISKEDAAYKFARIENKATVSGGIQLNMHDGSNLLIKTTDPKNPVEVTYKSFDILKLSLPDKQILGCMELKEGNIVLVTGGKNIGVKGKIVEIEKAEAKKRKSALVVVEDEKGARYQTVLDFVFSISQDQIQPVTAPTEEATPVV
jgi:small subunit ribosomal protein S4e